MLPNAQERRDFCTNVMEHGLGRVAVKRCSSQPPIQVFDLIGKHHTTNIQVTGQCYFKWVAFDV